MPRPTLIIYPACHFSRSLCSHTHQLTPRVNITVGSHVRKTVVFYRPSHQGLYFRGIYVISCALPPLHTALRAVLSLSRTTPCSTLTLSYYTLLPLLHLRFRLISKSELPVALTSSVLTSRNMRLHSTDTRTRTWRLLGGSRLRRQSQTSWATACPEQLPMPYLPAVSRSYCYSSKV